ncbi:MAG: hypothetical protein EOO88_05715 [Pedobacter sp.]|nr:MAG: hypothetical protein EOO88_05715 [Pedobacter sp.]
MKIMTKAVIACLMAFTMLASCKKDEDKKPNNTSRTLRYEVSGNFTGTIYTSYTNSSGGTNANEVITLPWIKEITFSNNITAAVIGFVGTGGTAGQKVTLVIKRGGTQVGAPLEIVAEATGSFSKAPGAIVF